MSSHLPLTICRDGKAGEVSPTELGSDGDGRHLVDAFVAQQCPDDPGHFGCQRHIGGVGTRPGHQAPQQQGDPQIIFANVRHRGPCTLDQHLAQVLAAALGDADEFGPSVGRDLPRHEPKRRRQITPAGEDGRLTDRRDRRRGIEFACQRSRTSTSRLRMRGVRSGAASGSSMESGRAASSARPLREAVAALKQDGADLIYQSRPFANELVPYIVQGLHGELRL